MARRRKKIPRRRRSLTKTDIVSSTVRLFLRLLPVILIAALFFAGFKTAEFLLLNSEYFKVKNITVAGEDLSKARTFIQRRLNTKIGLNIFNVDIKACESDIAQASPELKAVRVRRILPDTLEICYDTRKPFCQIDSDYYYLASEDGVILPDPQAAAEPNLMIVTGIRLSKKQAALNGQYNTKALKKAISLIKDIQNSDFSRQYKVAKVDVDDPQNPVIFLEDTTAIEVGEYKFSEKEALLKEVLNELYSKGKKAKVIDLRFDDVVVIPR